MTEIIQPRIDEESLWKGPDSALFNTVTRKLLIQPHNVIVYTQDGRVISRYQDNIWDIKYYGAHSFLNFNHIERIEDKETAKRIIYSAIMFGEGRGGSFMAGGTLLMLHTVIIAFYKVCKTKNILLDQGFNNNDLIKDAIKTFNHTLISSLSSLLKLLANTGEYIGITYKPDIQINTLIRHKVLEKEQNKKQKPVIPIDIFINAINQRWEHIKKVEKVLSILVQFIVQHQTIPSYARSRGKYKGPIDIKSISFSDAAKKYGLSNFFAEYNINHIQNLSGYITMLQCTSRHILYASTGMRHDEGSLLLIDCFKQPTTTKPALISGYEKKNGGKMRLQEWVTLNDIQRVVDINTAISKAMVHGFNLSQPNIPLFVSSTTLTHSKFRNNTVYSENISAVKKSSQEELPLRKNELILSKKMKKEFLQVIDPFRDWDNDKLIKVGKPWRFTFHQYRRTFAVYALNSGLVSLTALQRQFAHLVMTASAYYGKGSYNFKSQIMADSKHHPKALMEKEKEKLDTLVFMRNVLLNKNAFEGPNSHWMKNHVKGEIDNPEAFIRDNWKTVERDIKKGTIFCKTTALGRCYSIEPCDSHVTLNFTKCEDCLSGELDIECINVSIKEQENIIKLIQEHYPDSIESRTEEMQLEWLKKLKKKVKG